MNGMPSGDDPSRRSSTPAGPQRGPGPWWLGLLHGLASQATQAAEADRGRAALLAAVSHDLRTPLAAAKAAVSGLRSGDVPIAAADRDELLATAEESLDQLASSWPACWT
jgi:signal transduction histidine kinase